MKIIAWNVNGLRSVERNGFSAWLKKSGADIVCVYDKDGYIGNSTTLEIGYAVGAGKPIYALAAAEELCRHVLFREIVTSPEELVKKL
jgi:nucleoside 2-deoxyribosyltransferase